MKELRNLKYRFVLIVMVMLLVVTSAIFGGIYLTMRQSGEQQTNRLLEELVRKDGNMPGRNPRPDGHNPQADGSDAQPPEMPADQGKTLTTVIGGVADLTASDSALLRNSFAVRLDAKGTILSLSQDKGFFPGNGTSTAGIASTAITDLLGEDRTSLETALDTISAMQSDHGAITINGVSYRYLVAAKPYGSIAAFLDRSLENETLNRLISSLLVIGGIGMIVLFLVSLYLADRAIRPVGKAWERQKRFIADASHELKTPLTVIAANTDVILSNCQDTVAAQSKWLGYIKSETEQMAKLVNDLLTIAKLDAGENKKTFSPFDLSECVTTACLPHESLAFESGRELILDITPGLSYVGDESGIRQTVGILVDNAVKHASRPGNIQVSLKKDKEANRIRIEVTNPGEGIPEEERERIFERFYRLDSSRARASGGYGLGLSIAKSIVDRHEGSISVHSDAQGMTTFVILLPPIRKT